MFRSLVIASAMLALGAGSVCHAGVKAAVELDAQDSRSLAVSLAGLNLDTTAGARVALTRIRLAARQLCGDEWSRRTIGAGVAWEACYDGSVGRAVTHLNRPLLTALSEHSGPATYASGQH